jgi:hypothetical protein
MSLTTGVNFFFVTVCIQLKRLGSSAHCVVLFRTKVHCSLETMGQQERRLLTARRRARP